MTKQDTLREAIARASTRIENGYVDGLTLADLRLILEAARSTLWQDIKDAPKDRGPIVARQFGGEASHPSIIVWDDDLGWGGLTAENERLFIKFPPTHFVPLPKGPDHD